MITIRSSIRDYTVHFQDDPGFLGRIEAIPNRCLVVDSNVWRHHAGGCLRVVDPGNVIVLPVDEERKSLAVVQELYDRLMERSAKRNLTLVTIGGGTLQDISGFAASTLYRGINWILVPTTLLAQADSCIGSKTSLNYKQYKNLIGTFYPPSEIHIHPPFLGTLTEIDFFSGLGEVLKLHLIGGREKTDVFRRLLSGLHRRDPRALDTAIRNSLAIKVDYIAGDEFDQGRRNLLNFGHCLGHALEAASDYAIPHGQAVLVGIVFANIAARRRRLLAPALHDALLADILLPNLVSRPRPDHLEPGRILTAMQQDKKRVGEGLSVILLRDDRTLTKVTDYTRDELAPDLAELGRVLIAG